MFKIPVYILSGFLGSGKTTLLNRLLQDTPKTAVIINEFGAVGIDQQLLRHHKAPLSTLVGGCLCCQVRGSLTPILKNLRMAWEANTDYFNQVIIETSGIANPEPLLDILLKDSWLSARYSLQGTITTLSAVMAEANFELFPEITAQIAWADRIVITHTDLANAQQRALINKQLDTLAPTARRSFAVQGAIDSGKFLITGKKYHRAQQPVIPTLPRHSFNSLCLQLPTPLPWHVLHTALRYVTQHYKHQLVRLKGLVYSSDYPQPLLIQSVAGKLYPPTHLIPRSSDDGIGRVVFIYTGDIAGLAETFLARCHTV